ncbi:MAG: primosomal protein N' [Alistipes sp.]|jgi:primosomal protein N' (replication factor Y)|nr:primosomal protein N' [Alistipes sp.]
MRYAEIILPIAGGCYTFGVEGDMADGVTVGSAVSVQFGARKIVGGIVRSLTSERPPYKNIKPVLSLLFPEPIVTEGQLRLWDWMSDYYMCTLGEVMRAALPSMLKPSGFTADEFASDEFRPRRVRMVALTLCSEEALAEACEGLRRRAPKQYDALVELGSFGLDGVAVPRERLRADSTILGALEKKGFVVITERDAIEVDILPEDNEFRLPTLSPAQQTALEELRESLRRHNVALLFGVPSSGKSEVCFHAIAGTLARGRDVLLLLPEISLTTQFVGRVRRVFGDRVVLYHSGLPDRRRAEAYIRLARSEGGALIVGTRSSVFLPMPRLGLVVVDEEQDASYKQHDPAPRYNARDTAVMLADGNDAKVILASATPALETWANSLSGRYGLVELAERYGGTAAPEIVTSDTLRAAKRGERRSHFNKELSDEIKGALARGEQTILFQNRRGVAPFVECADCGHVPRCAHCGIPMTAHRTSLRCHYCGASEAMPAQCPACGGRGLETRGFGTEKIEEELARLFPEARIARLDRDSATSQRAYARIIGDFEAGATDILVGTQMITKGLDFAGVSLVGVLNADNLVNHPDFRASERAYALIAQVVGRAGRRGQRGKVVIQTASPDSRLIAQAAAGDYRAMAAEMLAERAMYGYPPASRLVSLMLRHADREVLNAAARRFAELLRPDFGDLLLGPQPPVVEKIKGEFALMFLLKVPRGNFSSAGGRAVTPRAMSAVREIVQRAIRTLAADPAFRRVTVTPDVDPQ